MKTIAVHYRRRAPGHDYQPVYDFLKSFPAWCHVLDSFWLVRTEGGVVEVRNRLDEIVGSNDLIAVFDVTGDDWAANFSNDQTTWMMSNMDHRYAVPRPQPGTNSSGSAQVPAAGGEAGEGTQNPHPPAAEDSQGMFSPGEVEP
jgi:hypothetical protein